MTSSQQPAAIIGLPSGFPQLNHALKGMRTGELIILAARPSQGKSVLGQQIATHNALAGNGTILFSLELWLEDREPRMRVVPVEHPVLLLVDGC